MTSHKMTRRSFLKTIAKVSVGTALTGGGTVAYGSTVEVFDYEVTDHHIALPRLSPIFEGYRIAHLTDFHFDDDTMTYERLLAAIELTNQQLPDLIVMTGDYITTKLPEHRMEAFSEAMAQLKAPDGVVCVMGNHDHWHDPRGVRIAIANAGIQTLSNTIFTVEREGAQIVIAGLDDYMVHRANIGLLLNALPTHSDAVICLVHEPDVADITASTGSFDLQLSGHTHGGQVRIPLTGRPIILPTYGEKYPVGQYQVGEMIQYTSRGLGMVYPAVRINCRPEIPVFTLHTLD